MIKTHALMYKMQHVIETIVSHGPEDAYCEHGSNDDAMEKNRTHDEMYNDGVKRVSNPKMRSL